MALDLYAIDRFLAALATAKDDDELRRLFETYTAEYELDLPSDPFGNEYRDRQFLLYERLYGKPYSTSHERSPFDVGAAAKSPFPYVHGSASTVGNQLIAIGFLIKVMALPKGSRILEFGPGWGNTTIALAKMGYEVTAIDVEPNFVALIKERARMEGIEGLRVLQGDFFDIESVETPFDAVLFFECFHHCADHLRLMAAFQRAVKPGGLVCFGAEPIVEGFPVPWGLRMDGESLWAIRQNGWLELGFNRTYFEQAMQKHGWILESRASLDSPWATALIAKRAHELAQQWDFAGGQLMSTTGKVTGSRISTDAREGYLAYGPYVARSRGSYLARVGIDSAAPSRGKIRVEVATDVGRNIVASVDVKLRSFQRKVELPFALERDVSDLEVRIYCDNKAEVTLEGISVVRL